MESNSQPIKMKFEFFAEKEQEKVISMLKGLRFQPQSYIQHLEKRLSTFDGDFYVSNNKKIRSREGASAVQEAIEFLKGVESMAAFDEHEALNQAASVHCKDLCKNSLTGHKGTDNSSVAQRVARFGKWKGGVSEAVALQQQTALDIMLHWIIDDGVKSRRNRKNIFNPLYKLVGVSCGIHSKYTSCAVLVLANNVLQGTGKEAIHLKNEYEKQGHDQFGVDGQVFNYGDMQAALQKDMAGELNKKWIDGAVSLKTTKEIVEEENGEKKTMIKYIYTMGDGSIKEIVEEFDKRMDGKDEIAHAGEYN